jgi:ADP-ribosylglycohydrolase
VESERLSRALRALEGLSVGDAFGERLSVTARSAREVIKRNGLPPGPWRHTDDTQMAMAVVETLRAHQHLTPDELATRFAERFRANPARGYGNGTRMQMEQILGGQSWHTVAAEAFGGRGSKGNGAAMRVAPLGAYFSEDLDRIAVEARLSAEVTHAHPEGIAGAIAVALAAGIVWERRFMPLDELRKQMWTIVLNRTPRGETWEGLQKAAAMPAELSAEIAARILGSGFLVTAPDTVPYALWCAARHLDNYPEALLTALEGDGDCDTNCAIVGGLVSLYASGQGIPADWLSAREPLDLNF